jgi:hypothetical protein
MLRVRNWYQGHPLKGWAGSCHFQASDATLRAPTTNGLGGFIQDVSVVIFKNRERSFKQRNRSHSVDRATTILF